MAITKFYKCNHCGNVLTPLVDAGVPPFCCGEKTQLLSAGAVDAAAEKHVPVIEKDPDGHHITVKVGSVTHPMTEEHYIQFIVVVVGNKSQVVSLTPSDAPEAIVTVEDNTLPATAYEYCNLHGLWEASA
ncbi:MAG: desulfoferrodoxin [Clostridiales Family XIII bacterium]|jgi:superoxide reductase|nr:desulfoferrodoxin [Clostridiales Family XIII bacterium]